MAAERIEVDKQPTIKTPRDLAIAARKGGAKRRERAKDDTMGREKRKRSFGSLSCEIYLLVFCCLQTAVSSRLPGLCLCG